MIKKLKKTSNLIESRSNTYRSTDQEQFTLSNKRGPSQLKSQTLERSAERMMRVKNQAKQELKDFLDDEEERWSSSPERRDEPRPLNMIP